MLRRIAHLLAALALLLVVASLTSAQPPSPVECPAIDVEAPLHELAPGEEARFTLRITPKKPEWKFRYNWFLSEGQPLTGQDTDAITVKRGKASFIDATVQISGGPDDSMCPVVSTDRATWAPIEGEEAECPSIQIQGPAGIPMPGQLMRYTARVSLNGARYEPRFNWSISAGEIVSGQGTNRVVIRPPRSSLTVTVDLLGLPDECRVSASESNSGPEPPPQAIKIVQFGDAGTLELDQLKRFTEELKNNPNNQGFIFVGHPAGSTQPQMSARKQSIRDAVRKTDPDNFDDTRITITTVERSADVVEFWRVPPGAHNPLCDSCGPKKRLVCPTISIVWPASLPEPGEPILYKILVKGEVPTAIEYRWYLTTGKIIKGQGTESITVGPDWAESRQTLQVTVEVLGLASGCPNNISETLAI